ACAGVKPVVHIRADIIRIVAKSAVLTRIGPARAVLAVGTGGAGITRAGGARAIAPVAVVVGRTLRFGPRRDHQGSQEHEPNQPQTDSHEAPYRTSPRWTEPIPVSEPDNGRGPCVIPKRSGPCLAVLG